MMTERVTVDFDEESYYLDGKYWESWDNYGEEMADAINELLDKEQRKVAETLLKHYRDLTKIEEANHPYVPEASACRARIIAIMNELGVDLE